MAFEEMTDQINRTKEDREQFQLANLNVVAQYRRDIRQYYIISALVSAVFILIDLALLDNAQNLILLKASFLLLSVTFILSIAQFINLLDKNSHTFFAQYYDVIERMERELYVLERFKYGHIDIDEVRKYHRERSRDLSKFQRPERPSLILAWILFILYSASLLLMAFSI